VSGPVADRARIAQINVSAGGVPKRAVPTARVTRRGIDGDAQRNRRLHGGPDRAVCLFSLERIRALQADGHPIAPGSIGENLTLEGVDWARVVPGLRLRLGADVVIQITDYAAPCANIGGSFRDGGVARVAQRRHPGESRVYARVLHEGGLASGDPARILSADEAWAPPTAR
jgi:MOSC domain-containing protein YiiM